MRRIIHGSTKGLPDARAFVRRFGGRGAAGEVEPFVAGRDLVIARAPGRLSLFGGLGDYAGAPALHLPLSAAVFVAVQRAADRQIRMLRLRADSSELDASFDLPLAHLQADDEPVRYPVARAYFARHADRTWAAGIAGALLVLMREHGVRFGEGWRILVAPALPAGRGLGTSSAVTVAAVRAICAEANIPVDAHELIAICQTVERAIVGVASPVADQATAARSEAWHLSALSPQATGVERLVPWPADLDVWGLDSGTSHGRRDAAFVTARVGAAMAYRILAAAAGLTAESAGPGRVAIDDPVWHGHLANVPAEQFDDELSRQLPDRMSGSDFLARFGGLAEPLIAIDPRGTYPVRAAAAHAVHERARAREFEAFLGMYPSPDRTAYLGELFRRSHESYHACGLVTHDVQAFVDLVTERGKAAGVLGAKATSGGGGGTVAVLATAGATTALDELRRRIGDRLGRTPPAYGGSSPGAVRFGYIRLRGA